MNYTLATLLFYPGQIEQHPDSSLVFLLKKKPVTSFTLATGSKQFPATSDINLQMVSL